MTDHPASFPIMNYWKDLPLRGPHSIPWEIIAPFEARARRNHGGKKSLERLAGQGGLGPLELWCVLTNQPWAWSPHRSRTEDQIALDAIADIVRSHRP